MNPRTIHIASVAITTFIPWLITMATLGTAPMLARPVFIGVYYLMNVLLFGVAFGIYYRDHKGVNPFVVMGIAILSILAFELVYFGYIYQGELWFLTWVDWFVPLFLISSTIYGVGKFFK